jgi:hypothetical protein
MVRKSVYSLHDMNGLGLKNRVSAPATSSQDHKRGFLTVFVVKETQLLVPFSKRLLSLLSLIC